MYQFIDFTLNLDPKLHVGTKLMWFPKPGRLFLEIGRFQASSLNFKNGLQYTKT